MNWLLHLYPGDEAVTILANALAQAVLVILLAWLIGATLARRHAALRYAIYVSALAVVLASPLTALTANRLGLTLIAIPLPADKPAAVLAATPASVPAVIPAPLPIAPVASKPLMAPGSDMPQVATPMPTALVAPAPVKPKLTAAEKLRVGLTTLLAVWLAGALFLLARLFHGWGVLTSLRQELKPLGKEGLEEVLAHACTALGVDRLPPITTSRLVGNPITVGLLKPAVVLPRHLPQALPSEELADVLTHECAHVVQRDHLIGFAQRLAEMLWWPLPLVHVLNRRLAAAREEVCDNYVLRHTDPRRYAHCLVDLAEKTTIFQRMPASVGLIHPRWRMEDRIQGIIDQRRILMTRINTWALAAVVAVFMGTAIVMAGMTLGEDQTAGLAAAPGGAGTTLGEENKPGGEDQAGRGITALGFGDRAAETKPWPPPLTIEVVPTPPGDADWRSGTYLVNGRNQTFDELARQLKSIGETAPGQPIVVNCDQQVLRRRLGRLLDAAMVAGLNTIYLNAGQQPDRKLKPDDIRNYHRAIETDPDAPVSAWLDVIAVIKVFRKIATLRDSAAVKAAMGDAKWLDRCSISRIVSPDDQGPAAQSDFQLQILDGPTQIHFRLAGDLTEAEALAFLRGEDRTGSRILAMRFGYRDPAPEYPPPQAKTSSNPDEEMRKANVLLASRHPRSRAWAVKTLGQLPGADQARATYSGTTTGPAAEAGWLKLLEDQPDYKSKPGEEQTHVGRLDLLRPITEINDFAYALTLEDGTGERFIIGISILPALEQFSREVGALVQVRGKVEKNVQLYKVAEGGKGTVLWPAAVRLGTE